MYLYLENHVLHLENHVAKERLKGTFKSDWLNTHGCYDLDTV